MKRYLAIFDLDGTLFDTNEVNYSAYRGALEESGFSIDHDYFRDHCNGRHYTHFLPPIVGDDPELLKRIHARKKALYPQYLNLAVPNVHLFHMIEGMRAQYELAIVTTASRLNATQILDHFGKIQLFDLILTQEDIARPKPDPEGFLRAIEHFGTEPANAIVFEDSDVGIEAALRSGASVMRVVR